MQGVLDFDQSSGSGDEDYMMPQPSNGLGWDMQTPSHVQIPTASYNPGIGAFGTPPYSAPVHQQEFAINDLSSLPLDDPNASFEAPNSFNLPQKPSIPRSDSGTWSQDQYTTGDLSDMLGDLKINVNGVGKCFGASMSRLDQRWNALLTIFSTVHFAAKENLSRSPCIRRGRSKAS